MAVTKVVVKYIDGRMIKGRTLDFHPDTDAFHVDVIWTNEEKGRLGMREIVLSKLKAVFFVRSFAGMKAYLGYGEEEPKEREEFLPGDETRGKKITIEFSDSEKLNALSLGFGYDRKGFFVNPVDPESNNERIFVIWSTVRHIEEIIPPGRRGEGIGLAAIKVVVRYIDGRMLKGTTLDFSPDRDFFHLDVLQTDKEDKEEDLGIKNIAIKDLKAIFFVESLAGKSVYKERDGFLSGDERRERRIIIEFHDGEKMHVTSLGFSRGKRGFFVNPVDPESNNIRIFVVASAAKKIEEMPIERTSDEWLAVNKVVVKYLDGRMYKGSTIGLDPDNRDFFHLDVVQTDKEGVSPGLRRVDIKDLKAIFFVKDFAGRPDYEERNEFLPGDERRGKKVTIEFSDGEKLNALSLSLGFKWVKKGFFVNPVDPESNNERIFVISDTVKEIEKVP
ncbi:hypothetical protein KKH56_04365 [bacterium]|nr:hypothetical protein [bacterium]